MEKIIVAFAKEESGRRIRDILESSGTASCVVCRSAAEVKRVVSKQRISAVVCGYKFHDESAEHLFEDLPPSCAMLMVAAQGMLEMCGNDDIFKLASPVSRGDLIASVRLLLQVGRRLEKMTRPRRSEEEKAVVEQAKAVLMASRGISEEEAHRHLQKRSMDSGSRLLDTARQVLSEDCGA